MKPTKRKGFSFLRSYFDVLNQLDNDADKLSFLLSIINKQFLDEDPKDLNFIVKLCYESQRHAIEKSVKGWITAYGTDLLGNVLGSDTPPSTPPKGSPSTPPKQEEQVQEQVQVQEQQQQEEERKIFVDSYDEYKNEIARVPNTTWIENFYSTFKLKDKTLSKVMDDFIKHKRCLPGPPPNNINDFKIHFYNWCLKVDPFGKLDDYKKHKPKEKGAI